MNFLQFLKEGDWEEDKRPTENLRVELYRKQEALCHELVLFLYQRELTNIEYPRISLEQDLSERSPEKMFMCLASALDSVLNNNGVVALLDQYPKIKRLWKEIIVTKEKFIDAGGTLF